LSDGKGHRSASQINTYLNCSELYRLKYVDKPDFTPPPAAWLAQGSAFHEVVQEWEESGRAPGFDLTAAYHRVYDLHIEKMREAQPELKYWLKAPSKKTEQDILERRERGLIQLQNYVDHVEDGNIQMVWIDEFTLGVEIPFQIELGGITVKGAVDQGREEESGVSVIDLKTGNRESRAFQLGIYKVAMEKIFGWNISSAGFYYAKDSKLVLLDKTQLARYTEPYVTDLITALDRGIENKVFIPNPGPQCMMCSHKKFCREFL
jgi:putative RecB family exonuclease